MIALTMLPYIDSKDGNVSRVLNAGHQSIVLIWCSLDGQGVILWYNRPGKTCRAKARRARSLLLANTAVIWQPQPFSDHSSSNWARLPAKWLCLSAALKKQLHFACLNAMDGTLSDIST